MQTNGLFAGIWYALSDLKLRRNSAQR